MIWTDFHFHSQTLDINTAAYVLLPEYAHMEQLAGEPLPSFENIARYCLRNGHFLNIEIKPTPGVERHTGETDARLRRLTLTEKSENLLADIRADHEAMEAVLTKGFTQNEKETMLSYLRRAKINVDAAFAEKQQKKERSGADG